MHMKNIKKVVIPVAGFGTRFLPASKSIPKEMFPIIDKPLIHFCVEEAIQASNVLEQFPEIDLKATKVGIWSRVVKLRDTLTDGDRIEIYRPLIADPKEIRKRRAEKAKEEGRADKITGGKVNPLKAKS